MATKQSKLKEKKMRAIDNGEVFYIEKIFLKCFEMAIICVSIICKHFALLKTSI